MPWSYRPAQNVAKADRRGAETRPPVFLLVLAGLCAALFVFGIISAALERPESRNGREVLMRINGGAPEEKPPLLVEPQSPWEKTEGMIDRGYRILWKKPQAEEPESQPSLWELDRQRKEAQERTSKKELPWDVAGEY